MSRVFTKGFEVNKWYEGPLKERKRPRYLGIVTSNPDMRHMLVTYEHGNSPASVQWEVRCVRGCNLSKMFFSPDMKDQYVEKIWEHECAGAITSTLQRALEGTL